MWDTHPILYWRIKRNGKWSWQKAKAAQVQQGIYAVEPPRYESDESEGETE